MIAIGIQKPDMGNILAIRPNIPLVKGLGPVMNIVLAYSKYVPLTPIYATDVLQPAT